MYKKSNGKAGFSFNRLITNAVPNFANDSAKDDATLEPKQQDDIFAYQMSLETPKIFNDLSLYAFGVVEIKQHSRSVLNNLKKIGIVSPIDGSIHTDLITKHFPNQVSAISIHRQRRLVSVLFFWEEELVRWRLLDEEEAEIRQAMKGHGEEHEPLKVALGTVWVKRSTPPSQRGREGRASVASGVGSGDLSGPSGEGGEEQPPPNYGDVFRTVSISGGKYHGAEEGTSGGREGESSAVVGEKNGM